MCLLGVEMFLAGRRRDKHDEANSPFSQFCERAYKKGASSILTSTFQPLPVMKYPGSQRCPGKCGIQLRLYSGLPPRAKFPIHFSRYVKTLPMYTLFLRIPVAVRDFSLLQSAQPCEAYAVSYSRDSGGSFFGGKTAEA